MQHVTRIHCGIHIESTFHIRYWTSRIKVDTKLKSMQSLVKKCEWRWGLVVWRFGSMRIFLMVCEEVSGESTKRMWYYVGATTLSFLVRTLSLLHLSMMQQAKKIKILTVTIICIWFWLVWFKLLGKVSHVIASSMQFCRSGQHICRSRYPSAISLKSRSRRLLAEAKI